MRVYHTELKTNGQGLWSSEARRVRTTHLSVPYLDDEEDFGELRVYFDVKDWDVAEHGLIYTDPKWVEDLREDLVLSGYTPQAVNDLYYSEQGMQGRDYVSLDAGPAFIQEWRVTVVDSEDE